MKLKKIDAIPVRIKTGCWSKRNGKWDKIASPTDHFLFLSGFMQFSTPYAEVVTDDYFDYEHTHRIKTSMLHAAKRYNFPVKIHFINGTIYLENLVLTSDKNRRQ